MTCPGSSATSRPKYDVPGAIRKCILRNLFIKTAKFKKQFFFWFWQTIKKMKIIIITRLVIKPTDFEKVESRFSFLTKEPKKKTP